MNAPRETLRRWLAGLVTMSICIGLWNVDHVEPQTNGLVAQGQQALEANKVDEAIALLEQAVAANGNDPAALAWLGNAQVRKATSAPLFERPGWVQKGFATVDQAVERFPDAFIVYVLRGTTAVNVPAMFNKTAVAIGDLSRVLNMKDNQASAVPDSVMPDVYLNLGRAYKKNNQPDEARTAWEKGRKAYPSAAQTQAIEKELKSL